MCLLNRSKICKPIALLLILVTTLSPASLLSAEKAQRVIAVGGAITEIIYALGQEDRLVAADTTSVFPEEAQLLPKVGYQRALSAEGVLAQKPDLLLANDSAGPPAVLQQLKDVGLEWVSVEADDSVDGLYKKIETVALHLDVEDKGKALIENIQSAMSQVESDLSQADHESNRKVVFLLNVGTGPLMAAGSNTAADAIISLAGGANAFSEFDGYKAVSAESMIVADPDVILLTKRTMDAMGVDGLQKVPGAAYTNAGRNANYVVMEGLLLLGFTPRLPIAVSELYNAVYSN